MFYSQLVLSKYQLRPMATKPLLTTTTFQGTLADYESVVSASVEASKMWRMVRYDLIQVPTRTSKQPIITHVTGYQPIRDQYFLVRSVSDLI